MPLRGGRWEGGWGVGEGLTMNVEFCEDNFGSAQEVRYSRKNKGPGPLLWIRH